MIVHTWSPARLSSTTRQTQADHGLLSKHLRFQIPSVHRFFNSILSPTIFSGLAMWTALGWVKTVTQRPTSHGTTAETGRMLRSMFETARGREMQSLRLTRHKFCASLTRISKETRDSSRITHYNSSVAQTTSRSRRSCSIKSLALPNSQST